MDRENFDPDRLSAAISDLGLSREDAANAIGVSKSTLIEWLKGRQVPQPLKLSAAAKALGRPVEWLCGAPEPAPAPAPATTVSDEFVEILPLFPPVPRSPELDGEITQKHLDTLAMLRRIADHAKDYLTAVEGRYRELREEIQKALEAGSAEPAPGVVARVEYPKRRRTSVSWLNTARELAALKLECPSCATIVPVKEDPKEWEKELRASSVQEVEVAELVLERKEE